MGFESYLLHYAVIDQDGIELAIELWIMFRTAAS
jgi:hypothetical protein